MILESYFEFKPMQLHYLSHFIIIVYWAFNMFRASYLCWTFKLVFIRMFAHYLAYTLGGVLKYKTIVGPPPNS